MLIERVALLKCLCWLGSDLLLKNIFLSRFPISVLYSVWKWNTTWMGWWYKSVFFLNFNKDIILFVYPAILALRDDYTADSALGSALDLPRVAVFYTDFKHQPRREYSSVVDHHCTVRWIVGSIPHGGHLSFQPVFHWINKVCGMCYPVYGMMLLVGKSNSCSGAGKFPLLLIGPYHVSNTI